MYNLNLAMLQVDPNKIIAFVASHRLLFCYMYLVCSINITVSLVLLLSHSNPFYLIPPIYTVLLLFFLPKGRERDKTNKMPAVVISNGNAVDFGGKITYYVILCAVVAATGGLMFGYDIGISG